MMQERSSYTTDILLAQIAQLTKLLHPGVVGLIYEHQVKGAGDRGSLSVTASKNIVVNFESQEFQSRRIQFSQKALEDVIQAAFQRKAYLHAPILNHAGACQYLGEIVGLTEDFIVQDAGRSLAVYEISRMKFSDNQFPKLGTQFSVEYSRDGHVSTKVINVKTESEMSR